MTDRTKKAQRLMGEIRYQVFRPEVTTVGSCARKCGSVAWGGGVCTECLVDDLRKLMPEAETLRPVRYLQAYWEQHNIERRIMEIVGGGDDGR